MKASVTSPMTGKYCPPGRKLCPLQILSDEESGPNNVFHWAKGDGHLTSLIERMS